MPTFNEYFKLPLKQAEVDYVNVDLETDTPLYLCPYAIQIRSDDWSHECGQLIRSFFGEVLNQIRKGNDQSVEHLLSNLHEPNETRLGESNGIPRGRGVGNNRSLQLKDALRASKAYKTGLLKDISEAELFIQGVGRDTISDLTTNIIRGPLIEYTKNQCELHGIPTSVVRGLGPRWNSTLLNWESLDYDLPVYKGKPIVLVPKACVRLQLTLDSQEFYNHFMIEFLRAEYLAAGSALVQTLKNGTRKVYKKDVKKNHPLIKDDLAEFVRKHPEILDRYKQMAGAKGPLDSKQLDDNFNEPIFARVLINSLKAIKTGNNCADNYHNISLGICTFIFHPDLIAPVKEFEQHDGRKRVDIAFTNAASRGFFFRRLEAPQTRAATVFIECKNYSREIANPELDQLSGRFNLRRGHFGMLLCRKLEDRKKIISSCRDTAVDGRGYMLPLEDKDLIAMLEFIEQGKRAEIEGYLEGIYLEISR